MSRYTFYYFDEHEDNGPYPKSTDVRKEIDFGDGADPWTPVLYEFCNFLSGIYGYNITERVFVESYNFNTGEMDLGPVSEAMVR